MQIFLNNYFQGPQICIKNQGSISTSTRECQAQRRSMERKLVATSTIAIMTAGFYICWAPYAVKCILLMVDIHISILPSTLAVLITKLEVIINPIVYIFFNNQVTS